MVYMAGPEDGQEIIDTGTVLHEDAVSLIQSTRPDMKDPDALLDPAKNPYYEFLYALVDDIKTDEDWDFSVKKEAGKLSLISGVDGSLVKELEANEYIALYWDKVKSEMDNIFAGQNVPHELYFRAFDESKPNFLTLATVIANNPADVTDRMKNAVLKEFDSLRAGLAPAAVVARKTTKAKIETGQKAKVERAELKKELPVVLPGADDIPKDDKLEAFIGKIDTREAQNELDPFVNQVMVEGKQINSGIWGYTSIDGLKNIYSDLEKMGVPVGSEFYKSFFAILSAPLLNPPTDPEHIKWYMDPARHHKDLEGLGDEGRAFAKAYDHLHYLTGLVDGYNSQHVDTLDMQKGLDSDKIAGGVTKFVSDNLTKFKDAIRTKDYATAGLYAVGIYAMYKSLKSMKSTEGGAKALKWMTYGAAVYAGNIFLKNAGYDVLKMAGIKDPDYEVKGTPMEAMRNILRDNPNLTEEDKKIDYGIVARVSEVSLVDLDDLLDESNHNGINFIQPNKFPTIFPSLAHIYPNDLGIGKKGLSDYTGAAQKKLTGPQKEYVRVGQQLYKIARALREVYNDTLKKDNKYYRGIDYGKAIRKPTNNLAKVRHLFGAVIPYAERAGEALKSLKSREDAMAALNPAFENLKGDLRLNMQPNNFGHFEARVFDFPVVFVPAGDKFKVYTVDKYGGRVPGKTSIGEIPLEGDAAKKLAGEKIYDALVARMDYLLEPLYGAAGKKFDKNSLKFKDGHWGCKVTFPGAPEFGIQSSPADAILEPNANGMGVTVLNVGTGIRINVDHEIAKQFPIGLALIPKLVSQKEFHSLRAFTDVGLLQAKDKTPGDQKFTILIGKKRIEAEVKYTPAEKDKTGKITTPEKFEFAPGEEAKLLSKDSGFAEEFANALKQNKQMTNTIDSWKNLVKNTPESYFIHLFESIPSWFTEATLQYPLRGFELKDFTGSVPKNYTVGLLDAQRDFVLSKLEYSLDGATSLTDVSDRYNEIFPDALKQFEHQRDAFARLNTQNYKEGKNFDQAAFQEQVMGNIAEIGVESEDFKGWRRTYIAGVYAEFGMDDLREGRSINANKLVKVFDYYAASADDPSIDGTNTSFSITKDVRDWIEKIAAARSKLTVAETPQSLATATSLKLEEVNIALDAEKELKKLHYYNILREHTRDVADKISAVARSMDFKSGNVPAPGSSVWGITKLEDKLAKYPFSMDTFVEGKERIKMGRDYVTFDKYLKMDETERKAWNEDQIILPRHDAEFVFDTKKDKKLFEIYNKLVPAGKSEFKDIRLTEMEDKFHKRIQYALSKLKEKYPNEFMPAVFQKLEKNFEFFYSTSSSKANDKMTITYKFNENKSLAVEVKNIERNFSARNFKTITRSDQMNAINTAVVRIIERSILDSNEFDKYFDRKTLGTWMKNVFLDLKAWVVGP